MHVANGHTAILASLCDRCLATTGLMLSILLILPLRELR